MEKFIIKGLLLEDHKNIDVFYKKLTDCKRLYIIAGRASVGKSAFLFKMLKFISSTENNFGRCLYIQFDESINHWKNQLISGDTKNIKIKIITSTKINVLSQYLHRTITKESYQLLIIDGIYCLTEYDDKSVRAKFLIELMDLSNAAQIPIILTERTKRAKMLPKSILHSHRQNLPETWFLERPEYYLGEIQKGDTRLLIY